ncbi:hypothetical protein [Amycolatopsis sp. cmx-4-61]|uniref:hypothetical protein n=1 Tax=Amycolatopsis sp. cmx-4-61 TaxID=2790937 RepID=UPI003977E83C
MIGTANPRTKLIQQARTITMVATIHRKHLPSITRAVQALQAQPPRVRTALTELRAAFTNSGENPPAILAACATLLNTDAAINGDILAAVRTAHTEWDSYGETERELINLCVYSSETRRAVAVTEVNDVTVMLREAPPRIADALNGLRWLNAATGGSQQHAFTTCATLLKNPSATHPAIVEAIQTAHTLWPGLSDDLRTLVLTCVYASKARAEHARARTAARQQTTETTSGDIHRCGNCDGNLAGLPEMRYCSDACRREAESAQRPVPGEHTVTGEPAEPAAAAEGTAPVTTPAAEQKPKTKATSRAKAGHEPIEKKADGRYVVGEVEAQYDEQWRQIQQAIPTAGFVRKDERAVDLYEQERRRHADLDDSSDAATDLTGYALSDEDYERLALLPVAPGGLCVACNLERTPAEQRTPGTDGRCEVCRDRDMPPLVTFAPSRELAAVA